MKEETVIATKMLCEEFRRRADAWLKEVHQTGHAFIGSKEGGALRRSSMELTRALAEMRKP